MATASYLSPTQRYGAGALFAIALHQAQIHQTRPLGLPADGDSNEERTSNCSSTSESVSGDPQLWVHENSGLLRPVFRFLGIDSGAWPGLEETAGSSPAKHHVGAFLRLLSEECGDSSSESSEQEFALAKAVDVTALSLEQSSSDISKSKKEKQLEYENEWREKCSTAEPQSDSDTANTSFDIAKSKKEKHHENETECRDSTAETQSHSEAANTSFDMSKPEEKHNENKNEFREKCSIAETESHSESARMYLETKTETDINVLGAECAVDASGNRVDEKPIEEETMLSHHRKVTILYELLSGCLADLPEDNKKSTRERKGYDARHRVALRLLATWLDIKWIKMEAIEMMVACSAMALRKAEESKEEETSSPKNKWAKWKRGGIIGAAALTGGTLMAITGGLAAPAIAAGFGALAPTLGTLIPVIGATGFAAAASAAGTVAGSVAVAASFGAAGAGLTGTKMARRTGSVDEFEFIPVGDNQNQGRLAVEILVSGFVFNNEDFLRPWEGQNDNLERYAVQWESKKLIAVSTAIQDFLTSRIAMELMKQGAMLTVLSSLLMALAWPATLMVAADFIDSKWTVAINRSDKAGKLLAEVLLKGLQGNRPVTLIGYSLGARVIFKCLEKLAENEKNAGIVERVVLLGAPISIKDQNWEAARKVVAGRLINCYSTNDWILGVAFRASLLSQGLAGIQPVNVPGIENVNVTDLIEGHSAYLWATQKILDNLELDTYYPVYRSIVREK